MNELILIGLQIVFIIFIFNFSVYEIINKVNINYLNIFEVMLVNILFLLNIFLFLSILNITINYIFLITIIIALIAFIKKFKSKQSQLTKKLDFIVMFLIISFIISVDLAANIDLGWDVKNFGFFKTLNFYQNNNLTNLKNLGVTDYPHLGNLIWSLFWKFPFNYNEYFGRIIYVIIYLISIFGFYFNLKINKIKKLIFILLTIIITYEYALISGLQEILIFSLILIASKFAYYLFSEKNIINQTNLIFYILLITNACCWIKNEGFIFILIFNFSLLFTTISTNIKIKLVLGTLFILFIKLFNLFNLKIGFESSQFESTFSLSNYNFFQMINDLKVILFYFVVYLIETPIFLVCIPLMFWVLFYKKKNYTLNKFIILFSVLNFLFLIFAFLFNLENVEWQVRVGLKRVMFETAGFYLLPILQILKNKNKTYE